MNTMRNLLLSLAIAGTLAACSQPGEPMAAAAAPAVAAAPEVPAIQAVSGSYTLDPTHTDVLVQWSHFGFSRPSAHFGISAGTLVYDAADPGKSTVDVTLPITALDSFVADLDTHLQSADFFDAAQFPEAHFKSTAVAVAGTNKLTVTGDLTIKGITKPVTLNVTLNGAGQHPMLQRQAIGFSATGTIKRSDFGVGAYAPNVSDEVQLRITTEGAIADAAAADAPKAQG